MAYPIYKNTAWFPPDQVNVSIQDIGFLRGFGIFDFFRIMDGKPIFLSDHLDRLLASAQKMGIVHNYTKDHLANLILELASKSVDKCLGVKMILTAGDSPNGFDVGSIANLYILRVVVAMVEIYKAPLNALISETAVFKSVGESADITLVKVSDGEEPPLKAKSSDMA
jgi:branched-subunit amino acid aminotransferase/4-amino-4-deoxychorismate lyase